MTLILLDQNSYEPPNAAEACSVDKYLFLSSDNSQTSKRRPPQRPSYRRQLCAFALRRFALEAPLGAAVGVRREPLVGSGDGSGDAGGGSDGGGRGGGGGGGGSRL